MLDVDEAPVVADADADAAAAADAADASAAADASDNSAATDAANARGVSRRAARHAGAHPPRRRRRRQRGRLHLRLRRRRGRRRPLRHRPKHGRDHTAAALDFEASPRASRASGRERAAPSPSPPPRARRPAAGPPNRWPAERRYALRVRVQGKTFHGGESQESALREVDLRVLDVNEPPWLVDARWKPEHALDRAIDENSAVGTPVGAPIPSHDVDARDEHALVYALEGASAAGLGVPATSGRRSSRSRARSTTRPTARPHPLAHARRDRHRL